MKVGDVVKMLEIADTRTIRPTGIIVETNTVQGHRYPKHTIFWNNGQISEIPEDILETIRKE